ncbi:hypothetical protein G432_12765 [Sphingomonas sp. MM-1]|uniref:hypothetical protein n=1 Tax=Sphingomonas sp. MM-1 TaxID=745310 RepID=UPI0002C09B45|nr:MULTISPECIES: hypothetical protein [unclassified Sphingomonas]AGH50272.1 hypothetical protein G432_12765 [Sphingomonas sp. MM-1]MDX3885378.1 hypothetical protein [Sphingomonas sp.]
MRAALPLVALLIGPPALAGEAFQRAVRGPAVLCGEAFALPLMPGEEATVHDPKIDFVTYHVKAKDGPFVLYEGNAPQPHDDELRTGLGWPNVVAIHDNRGAAAKSASHIRDRLLTGAKRAAACK